MSIYTSAFELKGNLLTLMVLHLFDKDTKKIAEQLSEKVSKAPMFFKHAPIVIDLQSVQNDNNLIDLPEIVRLLHSHGLIPVAVRGGNPLQHETALSLNLGILTNTKPAPRQKPYQQELKSVITPKPSVAAKIINVPIRSGQQEVAHDSDLIVLSTVSPGAEISAHRHIHVYGALRGRALAGIDGDHEARIFCQKLDAEFLSIAGEHKIYEYIPENLRDKPAQIYLVENGLTIKPL